MPVSAGAAAASRARKKDRSDTVNSTIKRRSSGKENHAASFRASSGLESQRTFGARMSRENSRMSRESSHSLHDSNEDGQRASPKVAAQLRRPTTEVVGERPSIASEVSDAISSAQLTSRAGGSRSQKMEFRPSTKSQYSKPDVIWYQSRVRKWYDQPNVQIAVAGLIFGNFIVSAINAQFHLDDSPVIYVFELFFNACFTMELVVNMYGRWFCEFWSSLWNVFDFVIVWISLISMIFKDLPGITVLRLFRAFRVFRLFKRIKNLRIIIEGVLKSLPGVCNAFFVLSLIMSIWAIMAVDFFREDRPVEFGNFVKAVVTFFQMMTYDGWCSSVARDLILEKGVHVAVIFVSYMFVNAIMMTNVVVAILLDKFINVMESRKLADAKEAAHHALIQALEARADGTGLLSELEKAYRDYKSKVADDEDEEADALIMEAEDALRQEQAEPVNLGLEVDRTSFTQEGAGEADRTSITQQDAGESTNPHEERRSTLDQPSRTQMRHSQFQADFIRDLRWMLGELDGLEQDISFLEGSLPQVRATAEAETLLAVQRVRKQSASPLGEAAPHMDGPRYADSPDAG